MTQKPKLEPGQRIRFEGPLFLNGFVSRWYKEPTRATVAERMPCHQSPEVDAKIVTVTIHNGELYEFTGHIWRSQVTHVLRPKQKPEKERGRIRCRAEIVEGDRSWISAKFFDRGGSQLFPRDTRPAGMEPEGVCLTEMRQGEVVLGREELARAWDAVHSSMMQSKCTEFRAFCERIGLGKDKA